MIKKKDLLKRIEKLEKELNFTKQLTITSIEYIAKIIFENKIKKEADKNNFSKNIEIKVKRPVGRPRKEKRYE